MQKYKGVAMAPWEIVWLKKILKDLDVSVKGPLPVYHHNMSNIHLAPNLVLHAHRKHIEVQYHFIREHVQDGDVTLQHIITYL